jgi:hypothetical protein
MDITPPVRYWLQKITPKIIWGDRVLVQNFLFFFCAVNSQWIQWAGTDLCKDKFSTVMFFGPIKGGIGGTQ